MKGKGTFPPTVLGVIGAIITIGGALLMVGVDSFEVQNLVQPLGVFFVGIVMSSISIVLSKRQKRKEQQMTNGGN